MTIKEISEQLGISADTLRYYERVGAIPPVTRSKSGKRDYQADDIAWVKLAICMRSAGCSIEVLTKYIELVQMGNSTNTARLDLLTEQREKLLEQRAQLDETIDILNYKISVYEEKIKGKSIA